MGRIEEQQTVGRPRAAEAVAESRGSPESNEASETSEASDPDRREHERAAREADARHERMDRVAVLFGEITAATREFLRAVAECDRHRDWAEEGFASCAEWLSWRIGITRDTAGEKVRAARALESLPLISDAMARGRISFSKVRALTRAATPENEAELLEHARACSAASLERLVRGWKTLGRVDEARAERLRHRLRSFSVFPNNEGMFVVKGVVTPEVGALLQRAIEAAGDALFSSTAADDGERPEPAQLRADALALVAERALAAGFGGREGSGEGAGEGAGAGAGTGASEGASEGAGTGAGAVSGGATAPISGSRAARYQVVLHVEPESLREHGEPGMCELEDGSRLSAESARRLACDAGVAVVARGGDGGGTGAGLGRKTRTVPPAVRRSLEARDRGCRFPGCRLRFTDAHHIVHWADGGETGLHNLILLCARHHRGVHEGGYRVCTDRDGVAVFFGPNGRAIAEAPPMPELTEDPMAALLAGNRARGAAPDWRSGHQAWRRDGDVPWDIEAAALEAMDRALDVAHRTLDTLAEGSRSAESGDAADAADTAEAADTADAADAADAVESGEAA
jgi:hypothetical protein